MYESFKVVRSCAATYFYDRNTISLLHIPIFCNFFYQNLFFIRFNALKNMLLFTNLMVSEYLTFLVYYLKLFKTIVFFC